MPKATHVITITGPARSTAAKVLGQSAAVYGQADLNRRLKEAKTLGVPVKVTKVK
jgi:hypothetical protein